MQELEAGSEAKVWSPMSPPAWSCGLGLWRESQKGSCWQGLGPGRQVPAPPHPEPLTQISPPAIRLRPCSWGTPFFPCLTVHSKDPAPQGRKGKGFLHFQKCCYWIYLAGWAPGPAFTGVSLSTGPGGTSPAAGDLGPCRAVPGLGAPAGPARSFPGRLQPRPLGISRQGQASESSHWPASLAGSRSHWLILPKSRPRSFRVLIGQFGSHGFRVLPGRFLSAPAASSLSLVNPPRTPRFHWPIPFGSRPSRLPRSPRPLSLRPCGLRVLIGRARPSPGIPAFSLVDPAPPLPGLFPAWLPGPRGGGASDVSLQGRPAQLCLGIWVGVQGEAGEGAAKEGEEESWRAACTPAYRCTNTPRGLRLCSLCCHLLPSRTPIPVPISLCFHPSFGLHPILSYLWGRVHGTSRPPACKPAAPMAHAPCPSVRCQLLPEKNFLQGLGEVVKDQSSGPACRGESD